MDGAREAGGVTAAPRIAVVIPCYRVRDRVTDVIAAVPPEVARIYCVDDACPEQSGAAIEARCTDPRVAVIRHAANQGVGGAMASGYRRALEDGMDIVVKIDGDGQMDPALLPLVVDPIRRGEADYAKGNRFHAPEALAGMPPLRLVGNALLSFLTKLSSGYWTIFDPTNGYTAIHAAVLAQLPLGKIAKDYFFESDMLFRLNTIRAVVADVPLAARYGSETSGLRVGRVIGPFAWRHLRNFLKRIVYNYYLRDFQIASVELVIGVLALAFGVVFGLAEWAAHSASGTLTPAGTIMLAALPIIVGVQMLLAFLNFDIQSVPRRPVHPSYRAMRRAAP
jgi:dolichol-phosphate mannosyltransferase